MGHKKYYPNLFKVCLLLLILTAGALYAATGAGGHVPHIDGGTLHPLWAMPFAGLLLSIAVFPLIAPHFWHHHYGKVSLFWGCLFLACFIFTFGFGTGLFYVVEVYMLEFIPFIVLLLALYTVSGGIHVKGTLSGSPLFNTGLLLIGAILASWMGTTGASMVLIRPLIRANAWRAKKTHVIIFFIFIVANIGGALSPLGDPPLFLGFLRGVGFFWPLTHLFKETIFAVVVMLAVFYIIDSLYNRREKNRSAEQPGGKRISIEGGMNFFLLAAIVGTVLASSIDLGVLATVYHAPLPSATILQVGLMIVITIVSLIITPAGVRAENEFSWEPIREVAKIFAAIFITMVAPIAMLKAGVDGPLGFFMRGLVDPQGGFISARFFWATGSLSSFLDNAPTYVVFFEAAGGQAADLMTTHAQTLVAISLGAVFMGANSYIGNAPNFMVRSIAEQSGVQMPSFFGYIVKYSIPILIPIFILISLIFF